MQSWMTNNIARGWLKRAFKHNIITCLHVNTQLINAINEIIGSEYNNIFALCSDLSVCFIELKDAIEAHQ